MLAIGDEGLRAVQHIAVAGLLRARLHALEVGAGARLAHRDRADQFARRELRQPLLLLLAGAVVEDVGRDDSPMQRRANRVEPRQRDLAVDPRLTREAAARAAVLFRHPSAEQAALP